MREAKLGTVKAMQKQQAALVAAYAKAKAAESKARGGSARANDLIHRMWKIRSSSKFFRVIVLNRAGF